MPVSPRNDGIKEKEGGQEGEEKLRKELGAAMESNSQLSLAVSGLKKENSELAAKNQALQEAEAMRAEEEEQLNHTIENQKGMIKKLEQELIQAHNEYSTEKAERSKESSEGEAKRQSQEEKLMVIIESKVAYINELEAEIIRYKTQIKSLKQVIREKTEEGEAIAEEHRVPDIQIQSQMLPYQSAMAHKKSGGSESPDVGKLQKVIAEKDSELDKVKDKIFEIQEEFDKAIDEKNEKIKELLEQIMVHKSGEVQIQQEAHQSEQSSREQGEIEVSRLRAELAQRDEELE
jgi:hypothetical protein